MRLRSRCRISVKSRLVNLKEGSSMSGGRVEGMRWFILSVEVEEIAQLVVLHHLSRDRYVDECVRRNLFFEDCKETTTCGECDTACCGDHRAGEDVSRHSVNSAVSRDLTCERCEGRHSESRRSWALRKRVRSRAPPPTNGDVAWSTSESIS